MGVKNRFGDVRLQMKFKKQKDFADFLGLGQSQYSKYENNIEQPNMETVLRICGKDKLDMD
ncbi:helix-turn-helix domain-containing protein, partial [Anaerosolibacter sp.]|uniref:helix-turn-helix domain-containing protein n=1 Tax=Anaerosolibacter sp. TaxID=1872527 RepID=UPI0039EE515A